MNEEEYEDINCIDLDKLDSISYKSDTSSSYEFVLIDPFKLGEIGSSDETDNSFVHLNYNIIVNEDKATGQKENDLIDSEIDKDIYRENYEKTICDEAKDKSNAIEVEPLNDNKIEENEPKIPTKLIKYHSNNDKIRNTLPKIILQPPHDKNIQIENITTKIKAVLIKDVKIRKKHKKTKHNLTNFENIARPQNEIKLTNYNTINKDTSDFNLKVLEDAYSSLSNTDESDISMFCDDKSEFSMLRFKENSDDDLCDSVVKYEENMITDVLGKLVSRLNQSSTYIINPYIQDYFKWVFQHKTNISIVDLTTPKKMGKVFNRKKDKIIPTQHYDNKDIDMEQQFFSSTLLLILLASFFITSSFLFFDDKLYQDKMNYTFLKSSPYYFLYQNYNTINNEPNVVNFVSIGGSKSSARLAPMLLLKNKTRFLEKFCERFKIKSAQRIQAWKEVINASKSLNYPHLTQQLMDLDLNRTINLIKGIDRKLAKFQPLCRLGNPEILSLQLPFDNHLMLPLRIKPKELSMHTLPCPTSLSQIPALITVDRGEYRPMNELTTISANIDSFARLLFHRRIPLQTKGDMKRRNNSRETLCANSRELLMDAKFIQFPNKTRALLPILPNNVNTDILFLRRFFNVLPAADSLYPASLNDVENLTTNLHLKKYSIFTNIANDSLGLNKSHMITIKNESLSFNFRGSGGLDKNEIKILGSHFPKCALLSLYSRDHHVGKGDKTKLRRLIRNSGKELERFNKNFKSFRKHFKKFRKIYGNEGFKDDFKIINQILWDRFRIPMYSGVGKRHSIRHKSTAVYQLMNLDKEHRTEFIRSITGVLKNMKVGVDRLIIDSAKTRKLAKKFRKLLQNLSRALKLLTMLEFDISPREGNLSPVTHISYSKEINESRKQVKVITNRVSHGDFVRKYNVSTSLSGINNNNYKNAIALTNMTPCVISLVTFGPKSFWKCKKSIFIKRRHVDNNNNNKNNTMPSSIKYVTIVLKNIYHSSNRILNLVRLPNDVRRRKQMKLASLELNNKSNIAPVINLNMDKRCKPLTVRDNKDRSGISRLVSVKRYKNSLIPPAIIPPPPLHFTTNRGIFKNLNKLHEPIILNICPTNVLDAKTSRINVADKYLLGNRIIFTFVSSNKTTLEIQFKRVSRDNVYKFWLKNDTYRCKKIYKIFISNMSDNLNKNTKICNSMGEPTKISSSSSEDEISLASYDWSKFSRMSQNEKAFDWSIDQPIGPPIGPIEESDWYLLRLEDRRKLRRT
ncbi:unnamed protein product [Gordionus sp. m RMFG-2023]